MKKLSSTYKFIVLAIAILFSINEIKAQCEIHLEDGVTMPVCWNSELLLSVDWNPDYSYAWLHNGDTIGDGFNVLTRITENNSVYSVYIWNTASGNPVCNNSITITTKPQFNITLQQHELICSSGDNGRVTANATGASAFYFQWQVIDSALFNPPQTAIGLKANMWYKIKIKNEDTGCWQTDSIRLKTHLNPNVKIFSDPDSIVYLDNPYVTWWFNNNNQSYNGHDTLIDIYSYSWEFDGNSRQGARPQVSYSETGTHYAQLLVTSDLGCDTTYTRSISVEPVKLKIPNIFTPNGDGHNDYFEIGYGNEGKPINDLNQYFLSHKLVIFNRWGKIVYESTDYKNDWDGGKLPDGTYFYVLDCKGETQDYNYKGSVMIWNSGR